MSLSSSQLYYIRKAVNRKTKVIVAAINREIGYEKSALTHRMVKGRITKELHLKFGIKSIADLLEDDYEKVLGLIKSYRFFYCGKHYG